MAAGVAPVPALVCLMTMPLAVLVTPGFLRRLVEERDSGSGGLLGDDRHASLLQRLHLGQVFFRLDVASSRR